VELGEQGMEAFKEWIEEIGGGREAIEEGLARGTTPFYVRSQDKRFKVDSIGKEWRIRFQPLDRTSVQLARQLQRLQQSSSAEVFDSNSRLLRSSLDLSFVNKSTWNHARTLHAIGICVPMIFQYQTKFFLSLQSWKKLCNGCVTICGGCSFASCSAWDELEYVVKFLWNNILASTVHNLRLLRYVRSYPQGSEMQAASTRRWCTLRS
jgi:hypothetical protein